MPITIETLADDLYLLHWIGDVQMKEIYDSHDTTAKQVANAGVEAYIHILDLSAMKSFPLKPTALLDVLVRYEKVFAVFVVNGSFLTNSVVRILNGTLKHVKIESYSNMTRAKADAFALLAQNRETVKEHNQSA